MVPSRETIQVLAIEIRRLISFSLDPLGAVWLPRYVNASNTSSLSPADAEKPSQGAFRGGQYLGFIPVYLLAKDLGVSGHYFQRQD